MESNVILTIMPIASIQICFVWNISFVDMRVCLTKITFINYCLYKNYTWNALYVLSWSWSFYPLLLRILSFTIRRDVCLVFLQEAYCEYLRTINFISHALLEEAGSQSELWIVTYRLWLIINIYIENLWNTYLTFCILLLLCKVPLSTF